MVSGLGQGVKVSEYIDKSVFTKELGNYFILFYFFFFFAEFDRLPFSGQESIGIVFRFLLIALNFISFRIYLFMCKCWEFNY